MAYRRTIWLVIAVLSLFLYTVGLVACGQADQGDAAGKTAVTPPAAGAEQPSRLGADTALASGFPDIRLENVAAEVGLDFRHGAFRTGILRTIFEDPTPMMGGGLCWIDIDNDGWLDLYLVNSYTLDEAEFWEGQGGLPHNVLYRNDNGRFTDISAQSGTDLVMHGNGCVAADFNGNGYMDLYVTADGPNALLWNNGDGTFSEGAAAAGVDAPEWSTAIAVADVNGNGHLDIFVTAYLDLEKQVANPANAFPTDYLGLADRLFLNNGDGTFTDVAQAAGLTRPERGLGAIFSDLNNDGRLELYVANDGQPNRLYVNEPADNDLGFRFVEITEMADVGDANSGMGVAAGDYAGDGYQDLIVTNWENELNALYRNETAERGQLRFQYASFRIGIAGLGNSMTGWGVHWLDVDHDTDLDLLIVNGYVPVTDLEDDAQLIRLYRNRTWETGDREELPGQFIEWTHDIGLSDIGPILGRGSAVADFDNDGRLEIAIGTIGGEALLLKTVGELGNWLKLDLQGVYPGARAVVTLPNGREMVREVHVGSSYLASEDPRLHFGLGDFDSVPQITIRWPDGAETILTDVAANQIVQVTR
jgi:hypothetical protein